MKRVAAVAVSVLLATASAPLVGCKAQAERAGHHYQVPNAVSGGTRGGGRVDEPNLERMQADEAIAAEERAKKAAAEAAALQKKADDLWQAGLNLEASKPDDAADKFEKLADDHPDHLEAGEARFREAKLRMQVEKWNASEKAMEQLLKDHPVNPHLAEVERMLYEVSLHILEESRGFSGIFHVKKRGFEGLALLSDTFPAGTLADDAILAVADEYMRQDDYDVAALHYQELLLRYPDSEWSFVARLRLGDAYMLRDQGVNYHAGYVELDPRGKLDAQAKATRPVRSCLAAALEQYTAFLDRIALDPARRAEYGDKVSYAQAKSAECRRLLAAKDRRTAGYYASRGGSAAASVYEASARSIESGALMLSDSGANGGAVPSTFASTVPSAPSTTPAGPWQQPPSPRFEPLPVQPSGAVEPPIAPPPPPPAETAPVVPPYVEPPPPPPQPPTPRYVPTPPPYVPPTATPPPPVQRPVDQPPATTYIVPYPRPVPAPPARAVPPCAVGPNGLPLPPSWPGAARSAPAESAPRNTPIYTPIPQQQPPPPPSQSPAPPPPPPSNGPLPPPRRVDGGTAR